MTSVSSSSRPPQPTSAPPERANNARQPTPEDTRAMKDALAAARQQPRTGIEQPLGKQQKMALGQPDARDGAGQERAETRAAGGDAALFERAKHERQSEGQGFGLAQGEAQLAPLPMPAMPSPTADPSAFARMLADLWTRENGKGAKEVRVRFGDAAWPATGARLIRTEGGALEIALMVGDRGRAYDDALPGLGAQLARSGLAVERLVLADDDGLDG